MACGLSRSGVLIVQSISRSFAACCAIWVVIIRFEMWSTFVCILLCAPNHSKNVWQIWNLSAGLFCAEWCWVRAAHMMLVYQPGQLQLRARDRRNYEWQWSINSTSSPCQPVETYLSKKTIPLHSCGEITAARFLLVLLIISERNSQEYWKVH